MNRLPMSAPLRLEEGGEIGALEAGQHLEVDLFEVEVQLVLVFERSLAQVALDGHPVQNPAAVVFSLNANKSFEGRIRTDDDLKVLVTSLAHLNP